MGLLMNMARPVQCLLSALLPLISVGPNLWRDLPSIWSVSHSSQSSSIFLIGFLYSTMYLLLALIPYQHFRKNLSSWSCTECSAALLTWSKPRSRVMGASTSWGESNWSKLSWPVFLVLLTVLHFPRCKIFTVSNSFRLSHLCSRVWSLGARYNAKRTFT